MSQTTLPNDNASTQADRREKAPPSAPLISVIVVSYNTRALTLECLRTLNAELYEVAAEVILVDNGSGDGTAAAVAGAFPQVRVIANEQNVGFAAANNQAMRLARGGGFLLLNSDAFPEAGAVRTLLEYLDQHPAVGAVGPRLVNADGSVQVSCFPFPTPLRAWLENLWVPKLLPPGSRGGDYRRWGHDAERTVPWVIGACMLVRREVYERLGGFDERFFMYAEETDWQRRMRDAGWEIAFTPAAQVKHLGGASGVAEKPRINRHFFQSLDYYELKHHGVAGLVLLRVAMVAGALLRTAGWAVVWLIAPKRRPLAGAKLKLLTWVSVREVTDWKYWKSAARKRAASGPTDGRCSV
jgi:GT2 family glycosyltransferase